MWRKDDNIQILILLAKPIAILNWPEVDIYVLSLSWAFLLTGDT